MKRLRLPKVTPRRAVAVIAGLSVAAVGAAFGWHAYRSRAGEPSERLAEAWHRGHQVRDRHRQLLRELPSDAGQRGRVVPLQEMGDRIVLATLVSEDKAFYEHDGVDPQAIARAVAQNVKHARLVSGASTITQQLVKLLDTGGQPHKKSLAEKLVEAARAQNLEEHLGKEQILEEYMNRLSYGRGLVGPEAAARGYFGASARELSWAQSAFLAVIPRAPSYLDPFTRPEAVLLRQRALLEAMRSEGVLSDADFERARGEAVEPRAPERPFFAPHFVESLRQEGSLDAGDVTTTTIDLALQRDVEGLVRTHLAAIAEKRASDAAVLVIDNARGDVLAWVGSADFHDPAISGQVDMVRALRQPGSTLKPFVYAKAFERGRSPVEMLADVPTSFSEDGRGTYSPVNFDGGYLGPISAREALAGSLNVPAIRLAKDLGPGELLATLQKLGFRSLDRDASHYGLALALGSGEVTLRELAAAYVALARGGEAIPLRVRIDDPAPPAVRVIEAPVAALVTDALSDPLARVRGLHGRGPFDIGFEMAVKTGTSSGYRDTWSVGYTRERTVAVWVGNADGAPTLGLTGASGAGPLLADTMRRAMQNVPRRQGLFDEGLLVTAEVCPLSGKLRGPSCPDHATARFARGKTPEHVCDVHEHANQVASSSAEPLWRCGSRTSGGGTGRTVAVLPSAFDGWLASLPPGAPGQNPMGTPWVAASRSVGCVGVARDVEVRVDSPATGSVFRFDPHGGEQQALFLEASVLGGDAAERPSAVEFVIDGEVVATSPWPFRARVSPTPGDHDLVVRPTDARLAVRVGRARFSVR